MFQWNYLGNNHPKTNEELLESFEWNKDNEVGCNWTVEAQYWLKREDEVIYVELGFFTKDYYDLVDYDDDGCNVLLEAYVVSEVGDDNVHNYLGDEYLSIKDVTLENIEDIMKGFAEKW